MTTLLIAAMLAQPKVSGWVVGWNPDSVEALGLHQDTIDEALVEWAGVDEQGVPRFRAANWDSGNLAKLSQISKGGKTKLFMMLSNFAVAKDGTPLGFEAERMSVAVRNLSSHKRHHDAVVQLVRSAEKEHGIRFRGIDLDYESMKASDRNAYSAFVTSLKQVCVKNKLDLSVTVHPKLEEPGTWDGPKSHDWAVLGKQADQLRVMTYDHAWSTSPAGPIAPNDWVSNVITNAIRHAGRSKVELGVACYGYDWSKSPATSLTWKDWQKMSQRPKVDVCRESGEYIIGKARFGGIPSVSAKFELAKQLGVRGVSIWYIGSEEPGTWSLFSRAR